MRKFWAVRRAQQRLCRRVRMVLWRHAERRRVLGELPKCDVNRSRLRSCSRSPPRCRRAAATTKSIRVQTRMAAAGVAPPAVAEKAWADRAAAAPQGEPAGLCREAPVVRERARVAVASRDRWAARARGRRHTIRAIRITCFTF